MPPPDAHRPPVVGPAVGQNDLIGADGIEDHDTTPRYDLVGRLDHAVRTLDAHRAELALIAAEIATVRDDVERFVGIREVTS